MLPRFLPTRYSRCLHGCRAAVLVAAASVAACPAQAALDSSVQFVDGANLALGLYDEIAQHVDAAMASWGRYLVGDAHIDVEVQVTDSVPAAAASSRSSSYVGQVGSVYVYEAGMAVKINQGLDVNGSTPDVEILFNPTYLRNELWFDPDPYLRQALVPQDKTDAMSLFIHEIGHALGFNGWGGHVDGALPANYASTWDIQTRFDGSELFFTGANARSIYGDDVPVTIGNNYHIGNGWGAGSDLLDDVMNGVSFARGVRYNISPLDLAIAKDLGLQVQAVPEPETVWLMLAGLLAVWGCGPGRRRVTPVA